MVSVLDEVNSEACPRCGGSGHYSYNYIWGTKCFQCRGGGRIAITPNGQPAIEPTSDIELAHKDDIVKYRHVLYHVDDVIWVPLKTFNVAEGKYNQKVKIIRIVDEKVFWYKRLAVSPTMDAINVPSKLVKQSIYGTSHTFSCCQCSAQATVLASNKIQASRDFEYVGWKRGAKVDGQFQWTCLKCVITTT